MNLSLFILYSSFASALACGCEDLHSLCFTGLSLLNAVFVGNFLSLSLDSTVATDFNIFHSVSSLLSLGVVCGLQLVFGFEFCMFGEFLI